MNKLLYYSFPEVNIMAYEYRVEHSINDIVDYEYFKQFHTSLPRYLLTDDEKEFVRSYNNKWWHNEIDEIQYYDFDFDFIDFLKNKHYNDAYRECIREMEEEKKEKELAQTDYDPNKWLLDDNGFELEILVAEEYN